MRSVAEQYGTDEGGGSGFGEAVEPNRWTRCASCNYGGPHRKVIDTVICGSCHRDVTVKPPRIIAVICELP